MGMRRLVVVVFGAITLVVAPVAFAGGLAATYDINFTSFKPLFGGESPQRVIEFAAHQWAAMYGANAQLQLDFSGNDTSQGECDFGELNNYVYADERCEDAACTIAATEVPCWNWSTF
jgi:hypothetical protein